MKIFISIVLTFLFSFSVIAQMQAEVVVSSTYLRKSPDSSSEKIQTIQKGERVTIEKTQDTNGWYYVSLSNVNVKGWIRKDTVGAATKAETVKKIAPPAPQTSAPVIESKTFPTPFSELTPTPTPIAETTTAANPTASPAIDAQIPIEEEEVLRVETEEVSLNVRVVDANNRPVKNLNQSEFKVYEDEVLQPVTSLTTSEVPIINALVIDNSRSLRAQLGKIIEAGKIIVGTNRPKDESVIVRFVSKEKIEVVQDFTLNKTSLDRALDNLFVEGGQTAIIDAVYKTAKKVDEYQKSQKKEDIKIRSLILVSDGDDRGSSVNERELFDFLRASQVQIYAVGFVGDLRNESDASGINRHAKAREFLSRLADETGGKVYFPNSIGELPKIAAEISGEMRTQYLISYTPSNESRDRSFRKIKVEITDGANREKRTAVSRSGRTSAPK